MEGERERGHTLCFRKQCVSIGTKSTVLLKVVLEHSARTISFQWYTSGLLGGQGTSELEDVCSVGLLCKLRKCKHLQSKRQEPFLLGVL